MPSKRIPVFVYKQDESQVGSGVYAMVACFHTIGVHVPFSCYSHHGDEDLREVGEATACNDSCRNRSGQMEDFSKERGIHEHEVTRIVEKAHAFSARKKRHTA